MRILFITGAAEYALEGYQVNPIHYLLKPVNQRDLERVLVGDWERNHRSKTLLFRQGTKWVALAVEDILYIESLNRNVVVHTDKAQHTFSMTLTEVEAMVPGGGFAKCHNSFLVNFRRVEEIGAHPCGCAAGRSSPWAAVFTGTSKRLLSALSINRQQKGLPSWTALLNWVTRRRLLSSRGAFRLFCLPEEL